MGNVGLRRDQLHNLWGSRQKENAEPLCSEITMKGIITNFRLTQQSLKPSPLSMELCVTAQAAPLARLASPCSEPPQPSASCVGGRRDSTLACHASWLPGKGEEGGGALGVDRSGESSGRDPMTCRPLPQRGPYHPPSHQPGCWVVWAHVVTFRC